MFSLRPSGSTWPFSGITYLQGYGDGFGPALCSPAVRWAELRCQCYFRYYHPDALVFAPYLQHLYFFPPPTPFLLRAGPIPWRPAYPHF